MRRWLAVVVLLAACKASPPTSAPPSPPRPLLPDRQPASTILAAQPPAIALKWRRQLTREVRLYWGVTPQALPTMAGQIHQESGWRPSVCSIYACGLGQQTEGTVKWLGQLYPADLGGGSALDPAWSIRALVVYDQRMWKAYQSAASFDDRWGFALSAYNGGAGWTNKERARAQADGADATKWFGHVERYRVRGEAAFKENRDYPVKILRKWRPLYVSWD